MFRLYLSPKIFPIRKQFLILILIAALIKVFSLFPVAVEKYYTHGIYPWISLVQRTLFGWIPFSVGDILYGAAGVWLIYGVISFIQRVRTKRADRAYLKTTAWMIVRTALTVYILFNFLWGLNYNRYGIDDYMKLDAADYNVNDLIGVTKALSERMNALQPSSITSRPQLKKKRHLFNLAVHAYDQLSQNDPVFHYHRPSLKPSIYSYLGNYLGFTGYYNPFTGESQVNTTVPSFIRPFTTCHEIGHSLGYAKESEANFAAYLSGTSSSDTSFLYSVYFEMYAYAGRYLYYSDSVALRSIHEQLSPGVRQDIKELRAFFSRYDNPLETAIDRLYSQYLKANEQPSGKMSYNEVVGMLVAYYKKTGKL